MNRLDVCCWEESAAKQDRHQLFLHELTSLDAALEDVYLSFTHDQIEYDTEVVAGAS